MKSPEIPSDEPERLAALRGYHILDTPVEAAFDDFTQLAAQIVGVPVALISLVDVGRLWFKSTVGLDATETLRDVSFCGHAILGRELFEIPDALEDERFWDNPLVTGDPQVRFYAGVPLTTPNGHNIGTLCVIDRVPRQLTAEQRETLVRLARQVVTLLELRLANRRLAHQATFQQDANQAKSSFLAAMSHEIRTPMNGVIGMIEVLQQSSLLGHQVEMVDLIRESAFSLLTIIDDILDFSKIEAGAMEIEHAPTAVTGVVEQVCGMLDKLAEKKGVELTMFTDPAIPAEVLGDAQRLRQVLINLVNNAIKFSSGQSRPGRVTVRAVLAERTSEQVTVEFQVADNGIGMDEKTLARMFAPFSQADASTTRRFGGTGLGLAISRNLVKLMGGEITGRGALGKGATFTVRLPFAPLPEEHDSGETASEVAGLSCLVVGAAGGLAEDLTAYLAHGGASVERVADLETARELATTHPRGLFVWIIDAEAEPPSVHELRAAFRSDLDIRLVVVVIGRGRRRQPRVASSGLITVDGNVLQRRTFLKAVAIAAGRAQEEPQQPVSGKTREELNPPSREKAIQQGRLILVAEDNDINKQVIRQQLALLV